MADPSATAADQTRVFPARLEMLPETASFVEAFCVLHAVPHDVALRVVLIVEELVTNTVLHGHRGESDAPIAITLARGAHDVGVTYEDTAPPFDPTLMLSQSDAPLDTTLETRPLGQLGLRLIGQFAASTRYDHEDGRNRLRLRVDCAG